jgi:type I restriction enzyme S subunit
MSESWQTTPLKNLANLTMGQSPESSCVNTAERGLPFLQGCAEFGPRVPSPMFHCAPPLRIARAGSVLISVRAPVGTTNLADRDYCIGRGLAAVNAKQDVADSVFLLHAIEQNVGFLHRRSQGSTFLAIGSKELSELPVPAFGLTTQRRIAEILATVDEAIEQTEALVQKWQQLKAGLMHDLFTRGVTAAGQLRPTRQAAPQLYKEEPRFGWIPKEWQPDNFGDKIELVHGYQFRDYDFVEDGIPVVKIGQVTEDGLDLSSCSFVSRDRLNSFQEIQIKQGDVLMALTGATLGKTCMVEETNTDLLQNYRVGRFEPRQPETVHKGFLFALLGFSKIRRQIFDKVNSGAQGNVGKADFERVRICLPPYDEQLLIHKRLDAFQRKIKTECLAVAKLRAQKQGLMQDLLTGRVPVRVAGPAATKA